jgi:hypothetical protein
LATSAEESRQLSIPSAARPPPIRSPETRLTDGASRASAAASGIGVEFELRDEEPAHDPQGSSGKTVRRDGLRQPAAQIRLAAVRIHESLSSSRRAIVDREVAPGKILLGGRRGSTTISKSCRPGPVDTSRRGGASDAGRERLRGSHGPR